jgi:hypothetical protein
VAPGAPTLGLLLGCATSRMATDALASRMLRGRAFRPRVLLAGGVKDLLSGAAWAYGLVSRSIEWRSNRLEVLSGSRLRIASSAGGLRPPELIAGGHGTRSGSRIKKQRGWVKARFARVTAAR